MALAAMQPSAPGGVVLTGAQLVCLAIAEGAVVAVVVAYFTTLFWMVLDRKAHLG